MSSDFSKKVVTRFAPSPTGFMHVGGARTAIYAWAYAKKHGGTFILRIEDTDKERQVDGSIEHIVETLKWLGITWDEGVEKGGPHAPYLQSERLDTYREYALKLIEKGYAYPDPYSLQEIDALRKKAEEEKRVFLYRDHRPEKVGEWDGKTTLRFKVPTVKSFTWEDAVRGTLSAGEEALDDFILIKSDGYPTYNFAHIIDDLLMGVTHIMRADEFIASTPKFLSLYEALEITPPVFVTLPPILGPDGHKKLSKRDGAKDILEYKKEGYLPDAIVNFLAFLGWNPGGEKEVMTKEELINAFSIERIHTGGAKLNDEKLTWFNKEHIKLLSQETQLAYVKEYLPLYEESLLKKLLPTIVDRIAYFGELVEIEKTELHFFLQAPIFNVESTQKVIWKNGTKEETVKHLTYLKEIVLSKEFSTVEEVKELLMPYAELHGKGNVLWPLRMTLSGQEKSIDPFTILFVLGGNETAKRIDHVLQFLV